MYIYEYIYICIKKNTIKTIIKANSFAIDQGTYVPFLRNGEKWWGSKNQGFSRPFSKIELV